MSRRPLETGRGSRLVLGERVAPAAVAVAGTALVATGAWPTSRPER